MLVNTLTIALGIMVGSLGTTALGFYLILNKKVMKAFTKYYVKLMTELTEELEEELQDDEA